MEAKIIVFVTFVLSAFTLVQDEKKIVKIDEFQSYIDPLGLDFQMPENYEETYVRQNRDLWYSFAIKDKSADFEVRYTIWSLQSALEAYNKCLQEKNCTMIDPNNIFQGRIQANVLNMTGGAGSDIGAFPAKAVKKEFNADIGGSSFFDFHCSFGKGYKYGQMVFLHKDNVADVIITFMSNDKSTHSNLMDKSFHSLKFKSK